MFNLIKFNNWNYMKYGLILMGILQGCIPPPLLRNKNHDKIEK